MAADIHSVAMRWRTQANDLERIIATHRAMARTDEEEGRDYLAKKNDMIAARYQGVADALRSCARQIAYRP